MFHILVLALVVAVSALVFVLVNGFRAPRRSLPVEPEPGFAAEPTLGLDGLVAVGRDLLDRYGVSLESQIGSGPREVTLTGLSHDPLIGGRYIIACRACDAGDIVPVTRLLEFRDEVKASGATRGVFLTDGFFASDARYLLEDAPVCLINRREIESVTRAEISGSATSPRDRQREPSGGLTQ